MDAINTALSGLNAASLRLAVSADNTANARTEGYAAKEVEQTPRDGGGVDAKVVEKNPATITAVNNDGETVQLPNVSPEREVAEQVVAVSSYKANARTLIVQDDIQEALLNITA